MVFCNNLKYEWKKGLNTGHNPYFNRWFSAIIGKEVIDENFNCVTILILIDGFLQLQW